MAAELIVEDGTVASASANSYVTIAEVDSFCVNFGLTSWASLATEDKTTAIIRGTVYIDSLPFKGEKYSYDDPLAWPRIGVFEDINLDPSLETYYQEIPLGVKKASCRAAYEESIEAGILQGSKEIGVAKEKIDIIEISYFQGRETETVYPVIMAFLKGLLISTGQAKVLRT